MTMSIGERTYEATCVVLSEMLWCPHLFPAACACSCWKFNLIFVAVCCCCERNSYCHRRHDTMLLLFLLWLLPSPRLCGCYLHCCCCDYCFCYILYCWWLCACDAICAHLLTNSPVLPNAAVSVITRITHWSLSPLLLVVAVAVALTIPFPLMLAARLHSRWRTCVVPCCTLPLPLSVVLSFAAWCLVDVTDSH